MSTHNNCYNSKSNEMQNKVSYQKSECDVKNCYLHYVEAQHNEQLFKY